MAGPSAGGVLVQLFSGPAAIIADALSFLGSAFLLSRIRSPEPAAADPGKGSITAGVRYIARDGLVRALLVTMVPMQFCFFMFEAIYLLFALRDLHIRPYVLGLVLALAAAGGLLGGALTARIARRIGIGRAYVLGCLITGVSLLLWPAAHGAMPLVVSVVFVSELGLGFGILLLDTSSGSIWAAVVPDEMKARVTGAFQAASLGVRPAGALLGGFLGTVIGLRSALVIAGVGTVLGALLLLPSPVPGYRMPSAEPALGDETEVGAADGG